MYEIASRYDIVSCKGRDNAVCASTFVRLDPYQITVSVSPGRHLYASFCSRSSLWKK